jgi:protocatechuate 3,4-dioxygenase beta subunit
MSGAAKGMAGLVAALALIGGLAFWMLKDDGGGLGSAGRKLSAPSDAAAQADAASAAPTDGAKRSAEEKPVAAESAEASEGKLPPGTPTAEYLAGLVVDHEGRPVADAEVTFAASTFGPRMRGRNANRIRLSLFQNTPEIPAMTAKTGADGRFRLAKVPRLENFDLSVDHPDFVFQRRAGVVVPARGMDVGRITLEAGGTVAGQVFGPGGARVANAEVWLEDAQDDGNPFRFFNFGAPARGERKTVTDEQGRFRLTGMPAGKCVAAAKTDVFPENSSAQLDLKVSDEVHDVVVNLEAGDRITGTVKGPDGKPVADAEIHVNQNNRGYSMSFAGRRMPFEPATKSDADGRFEVKALKRGTYEVSVVAKAYAVKNVPDVDSSSGAPLDVTLSAGAHVAGMVRLKETQEPARNVKVQLMRVWGDQVMPTSLDFPPDSDNSATQDGAFVIAEVDPGTYRVVARGDDTTRASSANFEVVEGQSIDNVEVTVERGAVVEGRVVDAATGAPVADVDVEAAATPQEGASSGPGGRAARVDMVLGGPGGARRIFGGSRQAVARAKSDATGHFELKNLGAGSIQIDTRHADYATTRSAPLELKAGEHKSGVDLAIGRGGAIEGAVTGLDGKPRAGDRIDVVSKAIEGVSLHAVTDGDGLYRVDHVPAGEGVVERSEAESNDGRRPSFRAVMSVDANSNEPEPGKPFALKEGDTARVDFTQQEKPYIDGVVRSASGPVAGVTVSASSNSGRRGNFILGGGGGKTATTAADGSYRLTDLEPGSYRISARHPESIVPVRENVELKAGEPARVDFFLEGGVIEGDVFAQKNHAKLEGAIVSLTRVDPEPANQDGGISGSFSIAVQAGGRGRGGRSFAPIRFGDDLNTTQVMSDSSGHFRVPWVPAGKWKVSVSHAGFLTAQSEEIAVAANAHVEGVKLELPVAAQLIVHLKSKGTGQALSNAPVELSTEDGGHDFGVTDEDGAAHFDSLKPGTWTVTGRKTFGGPGNAGANDGQKKTVETPADQTTEITIDV